MRGQLGVPASDVIPAPRRLAMAQIGGGGFAMHLDLGAAGSQLAETRWAKAQLTPAEVKLHLVDEAATARDVTTAGMASEVTVAGARTFQVMFAPYVEKRFRANVDGALGLDFFRPYAVYASWDSRTYFLKLRGDLAAMAAARLGRWGAAIPACPHPSCITAEITAGTSGIAIDARRDAEAAHHALEVFLGVTPAPDKSAAPLVIELPGGADQVTAALPADYAGATLAVLDVSPFARTCPGDGGCVLIVGASSTRKEAPSPGAAPVVPGEAAPAPIRTVALDKLHRVTGEPAIPPSDDARRAAGGRPIAAAIVKLCLDADGRVAWTKVIKSSGVPAYDAELQAAIQATWTFAPATDGTPAAVCTTATFLNR